MERIYTRMLAIEKPVPGAARTVEATISSEAAVMLSGEKEILLHGTENVDLTRAAAAGGLPILIGHDRNSLNIGTAKNIRIENRKLRATLDFASTERADEVWQLIESGHAPGLSIGYKWLQIDESRPGIITVTRWEPYEVSAVSIPADATIGIGRAAAIDKIRSFVEDHALPEIEELASKAITQGWKHERFTRVANELLQSQVKAEIEAIFTRNEIPADMRSRLLEAGNLDQARKEVIDLICSRSAKNIPVFRTTTQTDQHIQNKSLIERNYKMNSPLGLSPQEVTNYSMGRAIQAALSGDWTKAGFERECSETLKLRKDTDGFLIPYEVLGNGMMQRDLTAGTFAEGGAIVPTMYGGFIDALRVQGQVINSGATVLTGLTGNVALPRQTGLTSANWLLEGDETKHSQPSFDQVTLSPKTLAARTNITRRLMMQSAMSIETIVRADLMRTISLELDRAAIAGTGVNPEPRGILNTVGISTIAGGTNGAAPTYLTITQMIAALENLNAAEGSLGFLTNGKVKAKLMVTEKATNSGIFVWEAGQRGINGSLGGYPALSSGNVPSNLTKNTAVGICSAIIFANWTNLLIGLWGGGIEVEINPYQRFDTGEVGLRVLLDADVAVRNPQSFVVMTDALTA